uniref:Uncharacterized protein n=1 Tax=Anguilla anguilla TaxID=7936 RepID=A0A0E9XHY3_ANGAN
MQCNKKNYPKKRAQALTKQSWGLGSPTAPSVLRGPCSNAMCRCKLSFIARTVLLTFIHMHSEQY